MALLNFIRLHDVLCGSLGVIKFDIELVISYVFENIHLLPILNYFVHCLGLPLIVVLAYDMLWLAYFRDVVKF